MSVLRRLRSLSRLTTVLVSAALALTLSAVPATAFPLSAPSGVDVSGYQRGHGAPIHWQDVAADGQSFAFIKATEGETWVNEHFLEDIHAADQSGLLVGTYHYARPAGDPRLQAAHYAATLAAAPQHSLPPVLDIEVNEGLDAARMQEWVGEFLAETERLTGRVPMIYTYRYFWKEHLADTDRFTRHPLWLAAYQNHAPEPMGGWSHITFWQRSETGRVAGINGDVDLNLFNGTEHQLAEFVAGNHIDLDGALERLTTREQEVLEPLGGDNTALTGLVLATEGGLLPEDTLPAAAEQVGIDPAVAAALGGQVSELIATDALPVADLENMMHNPDYTVGDLLILLDNAG
ncbi:MAG: hydrolase [Corynebacterium humireducens]|jgi:GH25 family lysozyme M1 (1,4-beta-N-acetylmuramidase)|uniref:Hydrolase n=1 Tax=Corynebacterium humireducens TaxID=1223514 RepID=A0A7X6PKQ2_9CORY|nr:hydrolase [Corynebacterium humireducens]